MPTSYVSWFAATTTIFQVFGMTLLSLLVTFNDQLGTLGGLFFLRGRSHSIISPQDLRLSSLYVINAGKKLAGKPLVFKTDTCTFHAQYALDYLFLIYLRQRAQQSQSKQGGKDKSSSNCKYLPFPISASDSSVKKRDNGSQTQNGTNSGS